MTSILVTHLGVRKQRAKRVIWGCRLGGQLERMGDLEGRVHRQPFHEVGSRAIKDVVSEMSSCVTLSAPPNSLAKEKYLLLTSFCRFSTEPGLGRPSAVRQLENRAWAFVRGESAVKRVDFFD